MNSKQRKQAERLKKDMEFMLPLNVQKLNAEREQFKAERAEFEQWRKGAIREVGELQLQAQKETESKHADSMHRLEQTRAELKAMEEATLQRGRELAQVCKEQEAGLALLTSDNGKILADVLLQLELEADPVEIAAALRVRFGLAVPVW